MALPTPDPALTQISAADLGKLLYGDATLTTDQLAILNFRLAGAIQSIKNYLGFDFTPATATEYYDGDGREALVLRRKFVTAVSAVYEDRYGAYGQYPSGFPSNTLLTAGTDYAWRQEGGVGTTILYRLNNCWPVSWLRQPTRLAAELSPTRGSVKVTYTAGLGASASSLNSDLVEAIYDEAATRVLSPTGFGTQNSESIDGRTVSVTPMQSKMEHSGLISESAASKLQRYRLFGFAVG